jgi:hypothetical protein
MADARARPIDPRDTRWEVWDPAFRVYFWARRGVGWWVPREFEVEADDIQGVQRWIDENRAAEETFTLYAVVRHPDGPGLVRLLGTDPTRNT